MREKGVRGLALGRGLGDFRHPFLELVHLFLEDIQPAVDVGDVSGSKEFIV